MEDKYMEALVKAVEDMDKKDKTGMSLIDTLRPYSNLYHYTMLKISQLSEADRLKAEKILYGK